MLRMYWRARRADDALALANESLDEGLLDSAGVSYALGACARAYYARSGKKLLDTALAAGIKLDLTGRHRNSALRQFQTFLRYFVSFLLSGCCLGLFFFGHNSI